MLPYGNMDVYSLTYQTNTQRKDEGVLILSVIKRVLHDLYYVSSCLQTEMISHHKVCVYVVPL